MGRKWKASGYMNKPHAYLMKQYCESASTKEDEYRFISMLIDKNARSIEEDYHHW